MARSKRKSGGGLYTLLGIAAGAGIGAVVARVFTPGSGEENRERMRLWANSRLQDASTKVEAQATELRSKVGATTGEIRDKAQARVEVVRDKAQSVLPGALERTEEDGEIVRIMPDDTQAAQSGEERC